MENNIKKYLKDGQLFEEHSIGRLSVNITDNIYSSINNHSIFHQQASLISTKKMHVAVPILLDYPVIKEINLLPYDIQFNVKINNEVSETEFIELISKSYIKEFYEILFFGNGTYEPRGLLNYPKEHLTKDPFKLNYYEGLLTKDLIQDFLIDYPMIHDPSVILIMSQENLEALKDLSKESSFIDCILKKKSKNIFILDIPFIILGDIECSYILNNFPNTLLVQPTYDDNIFNIQTKAMGSFTKLDRIKIFKSV